MRINSRPVLRTVTLEPASTGQPVSMAIFNCLDDERDAARAVRSLDVYFLFAYGDSGAQHICHGALMVREQTAVGAEHSIGSAKSFIRIAESWATGPIVRQRGGCIEERDRPGHKHSLQTAVVRIFDRAFLISHELAKL